jgi:signal transduction histidine kinase
MNILLLVHNVGFGVSSVAGIGASLFIFLNNKRSITNITLALAFLAAAVFIASHVIGVNTSDSLLSQDILMFNLSMFAIGAFNVHGVLAFLNRDRKLWYIIAILYASGLFMTVFFIIYPDLFLLPSVPKMYFPDYYVPGILNWTRLVFMNGICVTYMLIELFVAYRSSDIDAKKRNQIKYFLIAIIGAYGAGFIPNFLVYNIPIDPLWGMAFLVFAAIPIVYDSLKYEFLNIKIVAKQAFLYAVGIGVVGGIIILFDYSNRLITENYPGFPFWITPLISAVLVVLAAAVVWRKLRQGDLLKYEFVTTVTHKFRTPLTHIKWASENLSGSLLSADARVQLGYIQGANEKLVELTGLLVNISEAENSDYQYRINRGNISNLVEEVMDGLKEHYAIKKITPSRNIEHELYANFDESRVKFVLQTFIENAVHYTPEGGTLIISLARAGRNILCSVKDSGIGIPKDELPRLFSKFYRGTGAKLADTEGMGIGLYISKEILKRHDGKIWAESEGPGKGSTFSFSLRAVK